MSLHYLKCVISSLNKANLLKVNFLIINSVLRQKNNFIVLLEKKQQQQSAHFILIKYCKLNLASSTGNKMETILENYKQLWFKSIVKQVENKSTKDNNDDQDDQNENENDGKQQKFLVINKLRLYEAGLNDLEEFLWENFKNSKQNLFTFHLQLAELIVNYSCFPAMEVSVIFLNRTLDNWYRHKVHTTKKFKSQQQDSDDSRFTLDNGQIMQAFDLAVKNLNWISSFNKIYNFEQNFQLISSKVHDLKPKLKELEFFKLICELKQNELFDFDYEKLIVPLMISDKYLEIDELIKNNEKTLMSVVELIDKLCYENLNFKKLAEKYNAKKSHKFTGSKVAKYGTNCLKRIKKSNLLYTKYRGILFQTRLNQLRFLINSKYHPSDPMSFEGWLELVQDLVGNDEKMINQLFFEVVHFNRDVNMGIYLVEKYGDKYIQNLPPQTQDFFNQNSFILKSKYRENLEKSNRADKQGFYTPSELSLDKITFVNDEQTFVDMLSYFEKTRPDCIGMDCEWKPIFGNEDTTSTSDNLEENEKNNRPNTFQIATRDRVFIIEAKELVDTLSSDLMNKFGDLILFSEHLIKLGYGFDHDSTKLANSFPQFKHKFTDFTSSVINLDEIANEVQRRFKLFDNGEDKDKNPKSKSKGLSRLTENCFGKPLDKSECMSNWQNKQLRTAQLMYAALDAFVLIQIHDFITQKCKSLNIDYDYTNRKSLL